MWRLTVFIQAVLAFWVVVMMLLSGLMLFTHKGDLSQALGWLALSLGLLLVTERLSTGRWFRWSRH
ncbi:hypothetical protein [Streptomyces sp. NPDC055140]